MRELDGLFSMETVERKLILPVLHNILHEEITNRWPMLSDRLSCSTDRGLSVVADQIAVAVQRSTSDGNIQEPPEAVLADYRRKMLAAANRHDLRRLFYELDDFLRRYPAHPQARILKDEIAAALHYEERPVLMERRVERRAYRMAPGRPLLRLAFAVVALGGLLYLFYTLLRLIFGY
jgi:hypothetical protein